MAAKLTGKLPGFLHDNYRKKGVDFKLNTRVTAVDGPRVRFTSPAGEGEVEAEVILLSVGRQPLLSGFGLENPPTANGPRPVGGGPVGPHQCAGALCGGGCHRSFDVGPYRLPGGGSLYRPYLGGTEEVNYEAIPAVIYTDPEVASVGETAESAARKGLDAQTVKVSMRYSGRYVAEHEGGDGHL